MGRAKIVFVLLFIFLLCISFSISGAEKQTIGLITINNYSGVDTLGGNKLEKYVLEEFFKSIQKKGSMNFLTKEKTEELLKKNDLSSYYEAANLCSTEDLKAIGSKLGLNQLVIVEINGYNEVKQEKSKKSYQLLLGLRVINCNDGTENYYTGEGFSDGDRDGAFKNSIAQLIDNYLNINTGDQSEGNLRSSSAMVVGNTISKMYHLKNTNHSPKEVNQINFNSRAEAEENQLKPCPICFPSYKSFSYSDRELEENLGRDGCGTIEYYYRVVNNPELEARVEKAANTLIKDSYRKNIDYKFKIIDSSEVNAFASPNGYIYVTTGLLNIVESEDELAFVIAHEMGHIERKHAVKRYRAMLATAIFASIFLASNNNGKDQATVLLTIVMAEIILKGYSREQENEADEIALAHLKHTNLDHLSFNILMGKFIDMRQHKIWAINKIFSTHPVPEKRIENLNKLLKAYDTLQEKLAI